MAAVGVGHARRLVVQLGVLPSAVTAAAVAYAAGLGRRALGISAYFAALTNTIYTIF